MHNIFSLHIFKQFESSVKTLGSWNRERKVNKVALKREGPHHKDTQDRKKCYGKVKYIKL